MSGKNKKSQGIGSRWCEIAALIAIAVLVDSKPRVEVPERQSRARRAVLPVLIGLGFVIAGAATIFISNAYVDNHVAQVEALAAEQVAQAEVCVLDAEQRIRDELPSDSADAVVLASIEPLAVTGLDSESYRVRDGHKVYSDADEFCDTVSRAADLAIIDEKLNLVLAREAE